MTTARPLSRSEIEAEQLRKANALIEALLRSNPFYQAKLSEEGIEGPLDSLDKFFARVPFTQKNELVTDQLDNPPYGTNLSEAPERYTRYCQTSGTSGRPLRWLDTEDSWGWMVGNWSRIMREMGVTSADRVFFTFSFGPFLGFWCAFDAARAIGCLCIPSGGVSSSGRLRMMMENQATVLCCTPTYALHLAETAVKENLDLSQSAIKRIIVAGEPGGCVDAVRNRIESLWPGARVFDHHGMTEVGPVTWESVEHRGVLHVVEPEYIAESIDPETLQPVPDGEPGELVLTPLGRAASPLLRFRTGDMVKLTRNPQERFGRVEAALEGGILSRYDDMVIVRGVNIFPGAVDEVVRRCGGVSEYRVRIFETAAMTQLTVDIEPSSDCGDAGGLCQRLQAGFHEAFNLRIPVQALSPGTLPRFEMKAKRWIRDHE